MKRWLAGLALLLCLGAAPPPKPPVWVIADEDTEITLYGTVHVLPGNLNWLTLDVAQRLGAADTLMIEVILPENEASMQSLVRSLGTSPTLPPLANRLPPATMAALRKAAAQVDMPVASFETMHPWLIALAIGQAKFADIGMTGGSGVEKSLLARARRKIEAFETPEEQLHFFADLSPADQLILLDGTLAEFESADLLFKAVLDLWMRGDIDALAEQFSAETGTPVLNEVLLAGRNRRWADTLAARMATPGKTFVAVGAAHLGGKEGLIAEMKARGFEATRKPAQ